MSFFFHFDARMKKKEWKFSVSLSRCASCKMQFDINICDTHVPQWRKQCDWKTDVTFSLYLVRSSFMQLSVSPFAFAIFQVFFYFPHVPSIGWFFFLTKLQYANNFQFSHSGKTFASWKTNFFCRCLNVFTALKLTEKVHYDFSRVVRFGAWKTMPKEKWRVLHK